MKRKKIISLILATAMTASLVVGCGSKDNESTNENTKKEMVQEEVIGDNSKNEKPENTEVKEVKEVNDENSDKNQETAENHVHSNDLVVKVENINKYNKSKNNDNTKNKSKIKVENVSKNYDSCEDDKSNKDKLDKVDNKDNNKNVDQEKTEEKKNDNIVNIEEKQEGSSVENNNAQASKNEESPYKFFAKSQVLRGGRDAVAPSNISFIGYTMSFDEGDALNGFSFEMNEIGAGTLTAVRVNGNIIKIDADLVSGNLNREMLETAINRALRSANIIQGVHLTGNATKLQGVTGESSNVGTETKAPASIEINGITLELPKGTEFNNLKVEINEITNKEIEVCYNSCANILKVSGNFKKAGEVSGKELADVINKELGLKENKFTGYGFYKGLEKLNSVKILGGEELKAVDDTKFVGFNFSFTPGAELNGYTIQTGETDLCTELSVDIDKIKKTIIINGNYFMDAIFSDMLRSKVNKALDKAGLSTRVKDITGNLDMDIDDGNKKLFAACSGEIQGGSEERAPVKIAFIGYDIAFEPGEELNGFMFTLGNVGAGTKTSAEVSRNLGQKIIINADLTTGNVEKEDLKVAINKALSQSGISQKARISGNAEKLSQLEGKKLNDGELKNSINLDGVILKLPKGNEYNELKVNIVRPCDNELKVKYYKENNTIDVSGPFEYSNEVSGEELAMAINKEMGIKGDNIFSGSGLNNAILGLRSAYVDGGNDIKAPIPRTCGGIKFTFTPGSELNGYQIQINNNTDGDICVSKGMVPNEIIISGNFPFKGEIDNEAVKSKVNEYLASNGLSQRVESVSGKLDV